MAIFGHDGSLEDSVDDRLHEEKGRWQERLDNFRENLRERLDETDRPIDETPEYDESTDEHII